MAVFVINEWLWADLSGTNGPQAQRDAFVVVERLPSSEHQIVVIEGSAFDSKAWGLCKSTNPIVQRIAGIYVANIRQNRDRCLILASEFVALLPEALALTIKPDDRYLVQAQISVQGSIIVTTDAPLRDVLAAAGLASMTRDEFLHLYFPA